MESIIELYDTREVRKNIFLNVLDLYVRPAYIVFFFWLKRAARLYSIYTYIHGQVRYNVGA